MNDGSFSLNEEERDIIILQVYILLHSLVIF